MGSGREGRQSNNGGYMDMSQTIIPLGYEKLSHIKYRRFGCSLGA